MFSWCFRPTQNNTNIKDAYKTLWHKKVQPLILTKVADMGVYDRDVYSLLEMHTIMMQAIKENDMRTIDDAAKAIIMFVLTCPTPASSI